MTSTRKELIAMLQSSPHVHGDAGVSGNSNKMVIVSVVGGGGLGKTTLAKAVYDELSPDYDCQAFLSVGRNPDLVQVFTSIFFLLDKEKYTAIRDVKNLQLLIGELRKFLEIKRYELISSHLTTYSFSFSSYYYVYATLLVLCAYYLGHTYVYHLI